MANIQGDTISNSAGTGAPSFPFGIDQGMLGIKYSDSTGVTIGILPTLILFPTLVYDTGIGSPNFSSGVFTVPAGSQGFYLINARLVGNSSNSQAIQIYKNGSSISEFDHQTGQNSIQITDILKLAVGDAISIYLTSGISDVLSSASNLNNLVITRVGSY